MADDQASSVARVGRESEAARRKRLDEVFGDVLPETTNDERDDRDAGGDASDRWLREQVPPHHGG